MSRTWRALLVVVLAVGSVLLPVGPAAQAAAHRTITYSITTQGTVSGKVSQFAAVAAATLRDPRGWSLGGSIDFVRVPSGGNFTLVLAAPRVIGAQPGCDAFYSCRVGRKVYINDARWRTATRTWPHGVPLYRQYVITHEVGHWLGVPHQSCPSRGRTAPAMQQQSINLQGCLSNMWPIMEERERVARTFRVPVTWTAIERRYSALGRGKSPLGLPLTWETRTPDKRGWMQHFSRPGGASIYATAATGAHEIYGAIRQRWGRLGWERGALGYPVTGELRTPDGRGRMQHFSRPGGASIYWTPATGAHEIYGLIGQRWIALGWERGPLGYPASDVMRTADGVGRVQHFSRPGGASIYSTTATGAHEVYGRIRARWMQQGAERGPLGYPVSGEYAVPGGRQSDFQRGSIRWDSARQVAEILPR
ncbi:DUF3152 domain-containing protein [Blastococcus sp. SYSU DS0617]